jgi:hypothetical protein
MIYFLSVLLNQPDLVRSVLQEQGIEVSKKFVFFRTLFKILSSYLICFTIVRQLTELGVA